MAGVAWIYIGSSMDSLTGSEVAILARASACRLAILGIFSMTHSSSWFSDSCTFSKYLAMLSFLASYSLLMCSTMSWESLCILTLEVERAIARPKPNRMTSYSASLFDAGNPKRIDYFNCSPVGDLRRRPTPDPDDLEAPSTCKIHHPALLDSLSGVGG